MKKIFRSFLALIALVTLAACGKTPSAGWEVNEIATQTGYTPVEEELVQMQNDLGEVQEAVAGLKRAGIELRFDAQDQFQYLVFTNSSVSLGEAKAAAEHFINSADEVLAKYPLPQHIADELMYIASELLAFTEQMGESEWAAVVSAEPAENSDAFQKKYTASKLLFAMAQSGGGNEGGGNEGGGEGEGGVPEINGASGI